MSDRTLGITAAHLKELQASFAFTDLLNRGRGGKGAELVLLQHEHVKVVMRPDRNHSLPHFHLKFKKQYSASYQIDPFKRLAGDLPVRYEQRVTDWIAKHQNDLLTTWKAMKEGKHVEGLVIETSSASERSC